MFMYMYHAFSDVMTEKVAGLNDIKSNTDFYRIVRRVFEKDDKDHDKVSGKVDRHKTYPKNVTCLFQTLGIKMDFLKAEIERKKRQIQEKNVLQPEKKYFKRGDLLAVQVNFDNIICFT